MQASSRLLPWRTLTASAVAVVLLVAAVLSFERQRPPADEVPVELLTSLSDLGWVATPYISGADPTIEVIDSGACQDLYGVLSATDKNEPEASFNHSDSGSYLFIKRFPPPSDDPFDSRTFLANTQALASACPEFQMDYGSATLTYKVSLADAHRESLRLGLTASDDRGESVADMLLVLQSCGYRNGLWVTRVLNSQSLHESDYDTEISIIAQMCP